MRLILPVIAVLLLAGVAIAMEPTSGVDSVALTQGMYCDIKGLLGGKIGMLIGFGVALLGLMKMIQGNVGGGVLFIVFGVLVTWLPNLIEGTLGGLGGVLYDAGISTHAPDKGISC